jgi:hypothetical protein
MGYVYQEQKAAILTDEGQRIFLKIRDKAKQLLEEAGAFRLQECIAGCTGGTWEMIACIDRLVELGEILELTPHPKVHHWGQNRVFTDNGYRP